MARLRQAVREAPGSRRAWIGVVAASGQVARAAAEAGTDLLFALNAGSFRNMGTGSLAAYLPYGNANDQTLQLLREQVLPQSRDVPVVAGVFGSDPTIPLAERLTTLRNLGVSGIVNWPAIGFVDGVYRQALEDEGIGIESELRMLELAREAGFVTFGFALNAADARRFAAIDVDALILNLGLTRQVEDIHQRRERLQHAIVRLNEMFEAVQATGNRPMCLAFGGPVTAPEDLEELFRHSAVHGFAGGSAFDRLPVQSIVGTTVRRFKSIAGRRNEPAGQAALDQIIGDSAAMKAVYQRVRRIAPYDVSVCLYGESGTGKELIATQLHRLSHRARHAFVTLNCGAIPESLLESELFGHERGAFTGADRRRLGKFELAHHGTLFLDEIADLSPRGQVALLRAIQQREINRVGGETPVAADVRIITASNQNLSDLVRQGRFRDDLFYRLSYITVTIPPLRERKEDLPLLVEDLLSRLQVQLGRQLLGISARFAEKLRQHCWPGNVRELQLVIGQAALLEDGPVLEGEPFQPMAELDWSHPVMEIDPDPSQVNREAAHKALTAARGNKSRAAKALGITRKTLYAWLKTESAEK